MRIVSFASGSKGNCSLVSAGGQNFLVDAGISMRRICSNLSLCGLKVGDISAIFITHQHSDHISGLSMLTKHYSIPVYAPKSVILHLHSAMLCPDELLNIFPLGGRLSIGNVSISSFATSHDTEESAGYRFEAEKTFAIATDTGIVTQELFCGLCGADAVIIESNHDLQMLRYGNYPYYLKQRILSETGHLSNEDCASLARQLAGEGTRYFILGHLSRENNTPAKAFSTVSSALSGMDVYLYVAPEAERLSLEIGGGE